MAKNVRSKPKKPAKTKKPKLTEKAKRYLYTNPTTKNQRKWNKEIERISRFEQRHKGIEVKYPEKPKRISQKDLRSLQKYKGKSILEQSTVKLSPERISEYGTYDVSALRFLKVETQSNKLKENETAFNKALRENLSEYEYEIKHLAVHFDVEQETVSDNFEDYLREYHEDMGYPEPTEIWWGEAVGSEPERIYDWFKDDKEPIDEGEYEEYPPFAVDGILESFYEGLSHYHDSIQEIISHIAEKLIDDYGEIEFAKALTEMSNEGYNIEDAILSGYYDDDEPLRQWYSYFLYNLPISDEDRDALIDWYNDEIQDSAIEAFGLRRQRYAKRRNGWFNKDEYSK